MSYWRDKAVVVTGGSTGFGAVLAQTFLEAGAKVIVAARDPERLRAAVEELAKHGGCVDGYPADVTQQDDIDDLVRLCLARHGRMDVWVNNVGRSDRGLAAETGPDRYRELWETNFLSAVRCTQAALPHLTAARGHLVLMGSLAAKSASRYLGAYPSSKFPLSAFAQQLRLETAGTGVHILLVCPGPIARTEEGHRYDHLTENLPSAARKPGGGVNLKGVDPKVLATKVLAACQRRQVELVVPGKARLLFAIAQLFPAAADRIIKRFSRGS